jgi:hypothetical protein
MVFHCITCAFVTDRKSNYDKHNKSQKHILKIIATKVVEVSPPAAEVSQPIQAIVSQHKCKNCEQCYRHKSSLSKHVKYSCTKNKNDITDLVRVLYNRLIKLEKNLENQSREIEELKRDKLK